MGTIVDVLGQEPVAPLRAPPANERHGVDVEQQRGRAPFFGDFGVEDVGLAETQVERLYPVGVLVQQISQVGRRLVGRGGREEHLSPTLRSGSR